ncbi:group 1 glycosyl transferase [Calothrix sp. NIES-2100]|nr:group 1 glycosyl transferase [Calothrix sp. NIES-2100]
MSITAISPTPNPNLVIFNGRLLPKSETFIRSQGEGLQLFTPYYVGARLIKGLPLPPERTLAINQGGILGSAKELIFKYSGYAPQLSQQLQQLNPKLIHAHFGVCGTLALPLARSLKLPLMVTFHGLDATMTDEYARKDSITTRIYLRRREALKQETKLFIAVSNFLKNRLIQQGFPADRILVHYIGVDTKIFQPDPSIVREPVVLFVGRLVEKKGCQYLIEAMAKVQAAMPEVKLVVIGDGPLRGTVENAAKSSLKNYQFLGIQPPEVVRNWMNRAKVFCVPSVQAASGDCEGFGIVFAEAQAVGLPVVSFAHGGIPEAVAHNETGLLAKEGNSQELADYILQLFQDSNLWQRFSFNAHNRIVKQFDLHQQIQVLENIYQAVVDEESASQKTLTRFI